MKRIALKISIALLLVLCTGVVIVQGVLWSNLPRRIVVAELRQATGLNVQIDRVSAGGLWFGSSSVRGVRISLPLGSQPAVEIDRVKLRHTSLIPLLVSRSLRVHRVEVHSPVVYARQSEAGQWDLAEVLATLAANLKQVSGSQGGGLLELPVIEVADATVELQPADGPVAVLRDTNLTGANAGQLNYRFTFDAAGLGQVTGRVARSQPFAHELAFDLTPAAALLAAATGQGGLQGISAKGTWQGQVQGSDVTGMLELAEAAWQGMGRIRGTSAVLVQGAEAAVRVEPVALSAAGQAISKQVKLTGGALTYRAGEVQVTQLRAEAADGAVVLDGKVDPRAQVGSLVAAWDELRYPSGATHHGKLTVELGRKHNLDREVQATLETTGQTAGVAWAGTVEIEAQGNSWANLAGQVVADDLQIAVAQKQPQRFNLAGTLALQPTAVTLAELTIDTAHDAGVVRGQGRYDWAARDWSLSVTGRDVPWFGLPELISEAQVQLEGEQGIARLTQATLRSTSAELEAQGAYDFDSASPVSLNITVKQLPMHLRRGDRQVLQAQSFGGSLALRGSINPIALTADGELLARALRLNHENLGDMTLKVTGKADDTQLTLAADAVEWLGGQWILRLAYDRTQSLASLFVNAANLDLSLVDALTQRTLGIDVGTMDVALVATQLGTQIDRMRIAGNLKARDFKRGPLAVDVLDARVRLADGRLRLTDLKASYDGGQLAGAAAMNLDQPDRLTANATLTDWPTRLAGGRVQLLTSAALNATFDLTQRTGKGDGSLTIQGQLDSLELGEVRLTTTLDEQFLTLNQLAGRVLAGELAGSGRIDLIEPQYSTLDVAWDGAQLQQMAAVAAPLGEIEGAVSSKLAMSRTDSPRAVGPIQAQLTITASDASFRGLPLGQGSATAYFDQDRFVLHEAQLEALGGKMQMWGRISEHFGQWYLFASGGAENLDLGLLTSTLWPGRPAILGQVGGEVTINTAVHDWNMAIGKGSLTLRDSDLGNIPLFSALYDLINIRIGDASPQGWGDARFRVEDGVLLFERFHYANRGGQLQLFGRVADIWKGLESPVSGYAIVSVKPLPDVQLLNVLNEALVAIQKEITSVRVGGTMNEPEVRVVPLVGMLESVGRMFSSPKASPEPGADDGPYDP